MQKVLAAAGLGSRRKCEELILAGRVEVDRQIVDQLGSRVDTQRQEIRVDGTRLAPAKKVYYIVNKPTGVVSTNYDPSGRPRVIDLVPAGAARVFSVGRLDLASEGLILVTNDGGLADRLTHPRYDVEKTYDVLVAGTPTDDELAQLKRGIHLAEGKARAVRVRVKGRHKQSTHLEVVLNEGRNREVRRILARIGHKVLKLRRVALAGLRFADVPLGASRRLTHEELRVLRHGGRRKSTKSRSPRPKAAPARDRKASHRKTARAGSPRSPQGRRPARRSR